MGVKGLQSFLRNNPHLSQRLELSNTTLIIDSSGIQIDLFFASCRRRDSKDITPDKYGSDLVAYSKEVMKFFRTLDSCNITPILVYDGSSIGKKSTSNRHELQEKGKYKKALERFNNGQKTTELSKSEKIVSKLISTVFKSIVKELKIKAIQAPYEADIHLAKLANKYSCHILTNDTDFMIYPLPAGFIILDMFRYKRPERNRTRDGKFIECVKFSQHRLVKFVPGLQRETMPLLSILLGDNYINRKTFDSVINNLTCDKLYQVRFEAVTEQHRRIVRILNWLRGKSLSEAKDLIMNKIKPSDRDKIDLLVTELLHNYEIESSDNLQSELQKVYPPREKSSEAELMPAAYIAGVYEHSALPSFALDIIFHNTQYFHPMIDDLALPSASFSVKSRPFSLAITLLRPRTYEGMSPEQRDEEIQRDSIRVYDRFDGEYDLRHIQPMEYLEDFGSLEHLDLYSTIRLEPGSKRAILFSTFRFTDEELTSMTKTLSQVFYEPYLHEATVCFLLVKYMSLETKLNPGAAFVEGLMLALLYYAHIEGKLREAIYKSSKEFKQLILTLKPHSMTNNLERNITPEPLFRGINHFISMLQFAYVSFNLINEILDQVLPSPRVERFFNGPLIFRMTKELLVTKLTTLCSEMSSFLDICDSIKTSVLPAQ